MRVNVKRGAIVLGRTETRRLEQRGPFDQRDADEQRRAIFAAVKELAAREDAPRTIEAYACARAGGYMIDQWITRETRDYLATT